MTALSRYSCSVGLVDRIVEVMLHLRGILPLIPFLVSSSSYLFQPKGFLDQRLPLVLGMLSTTSDSSAHVS